MTDTDIKTIPTGWKMTTLGEVIFPVSDTFNFAGKESVHFLNTGDIVDGKLYHPYQNLVPVATLPGQAKKSFQKNDILFSEIRPENKRYMLVDFDSLNSVASTKLMVLRTKEDIDVKFIYQFITSQEALREFQQIAESRSGTFPQITFDSVTHFPILLPPLSEQRAISAVLSSLDNKIELLQEENKTLEAIAQAMFKEWFVNFNFPGSTGKMIDSELGKIPDGWRVGKYSDLVDVVTGKGIKRENLRNDGLYQVLGANGEIGKTNEYLFDEDLILTGRVGTLGTIFFSKGKVWISDNVLISKPLTKENYYFAYFQLNRIDLKNMNRGSTQPLITQTDLKNVTIIIPSEKILESWDVIVSTIFSKVFNGNSQVNALSILRDSLLPKLMKGEIRVSI